MLWFLLSFGLEVAESNTGKLLFVCDPRLLGGDQVASVATRSIGRAGLGAENDDCALKHVVVVGISFQEFRLRQPEEAVVFGPLVGTVAS